ncbi:MFS transporter [Nocardioides insulae]|uniref:MFS transporter n=1 Tax=Nocardioides insulae TaxID=394734 RepID=UPI0004169278|nr:MFS transporter [Nocardioides insulae]
MTTESQESTITLDRPPGPGFWAGIRNRHLEHYPSTGPRIGYLVLVVAITVMLYYTLYVGGAVSTLLLVEFGMSFKFYVWALAFGNLAGAFGALAGGVADKIGRTHLVVYGLLLTSLLTAFVIPAMDAKWPFIIATTLVGVVEGMILVATPALIRDFSPQVGRATAMGFWTIGPVLGSLIVGVVGSMTIDENSQWQSQFRICGFVGLVVFVIAFLFLRELSPSIRNQLMVSEQDRALVEARAQGIDVEAALKNPIRQLLTAPIILSSLAVSVLLFSYYTAIAFGTVIYTTIFGFALDQANSVATWQWGVNVVALIAAGLLSDRLRVRKPFMVVGGLGTALMIVLLLQQFGGNPSFGTLTTIIALMSAVCAFGYAPWMASFTETVEAQNPALIATGLAIWGWIQRLTVFASFLLVPLVVTAMTPLVNYGAQTAEIATEYQAELATAAVIEPETMAAISADPTDTTAQAAAVGQIVDAQGVSQEEAVAELTALGQVPPEAMSFLAEHGDSVENAAAEAPGQWQTWYWVCFGGAIFFVGCVPLLKGRWSPRAAKRDAEEHTRRVEQELAALEATSANR